MEPTITADIVVAYSQCPRKAYLLLFSPDKGEPHEYVQILEQQRGEHQERYLNCLQQTHADVQPYSLENLRKGSKVLINTRLQVDGFVADCGVLTRVEGTSTFGKYSYEPSLFVGTHSISKEQQLERTRSSSENLILAITAARGVPCRHGNTACIPARGVGTDPTRSASLYSGAGSVSGDLGIPGPRLTGAGPHVTGTAAPNLPAFLTSTFERSATARTATSPAESSTSRRTTGSPWPDANPDACGRSR